MIRAVLGVGPSKGWSSEGMLVKNYLTLTNSTEWTTIKLTHWGPILQSRCLRTQPHNYLLPTPTNPAKRATCWSRYKPESITMIWPWSGILRRGVYSSTFFDFIPPLVRSSHYSIWLNITYLTPFYSILRITSTAGVQSTYSLPGLLWT